jgi:hypothetical protein
MNDIDNILLNPVKDTAGRSLKLTVRQVRNFGRDRGIAEVSQL